MCPDTRKIKELSLQAMAAAHKAHNDGGATQHNVERNLIHRESESEDSSIHPSVHPDLSFFLKGDDKRAGALKYS